MREDLNRCLAGNPDKRWEAAGELASRLRALPERRAVEARRRPELAARERTAYRRGLARASAIGIAVAALLCGLVIYAFKMRDGERIARAGVLLQQAQSLQGSIAPEAARRGLEFIKSAASIANPAQAAELRNAAVFHLCRPGARDSDPIAIIGSAGSTPNSTYSHFCAISSNRQVTVSKIAGTNTSGVWSAEALPEGEWSLSLSPSGSRIAAFSPNRPLRIAAEGIRRWRDSSRPVSALNVTWRESNDLIAATATGYLRMTDTNDFAPRPEFGTMEALLPGVQRRLVKSPGLSFMAVDPSGKSLATVAEGAQSVTLLSLQGPEKRSSIFHARPISAFAWKPSFEELGCAVGCEDGSVHLWSFPGGPNARSNERPDHVLRMPVGGPQPPVKGVAWRKDGDLIAALHGDSTIYLWEHSWKQGTWSVLGVIGVPATTAQITFEESGTLIARLADGRLIPMRGYDDLPFRERSFDRLAWSQLTGAFNGELAVGLTSGSIFAFDPYTLETLGPQRGAFLTRAEVHPISKALF